MKHTGSKKSERGSAILMTLGILSMVMTLGMIFAVTSRNERTISMAGADDSQAALTSESAEAFAFAILQEMSQTSSTYRPADKTDEVVVYSDDTDTTRHQPYIGNYKDNGASIVHNVTLSNGDYTQNAVYTIFDAGEYDTTDVDDTDNKDNSLWTEINKSSYGDFIGGAAYNALKVLNVNGPGYRNVKNASNEVIGRYGFVILPEGSKFELNALVNPMTGNSIPVMASKTEIKKDGDGTYPDMDPTGTYISQGKGAFPIMGFDDDDTYDYSHSINEMATLRYGIHPQEIRTADAYAVPGGNAPKWYDYLQLVDATSFPDFKEKDVLLYRMAGGKDEPEMAYDGKAWLKDADGKTLVYPDVLDPTENVSAGSGDTAEDTEAKNLPKLAKVNIQLPDLTCDTDNKMGWENASIHFKGSHAACITHDTCTWYDNIFLKSAILGGVNNPIEFQDEGGNNINCHIMANMVDFCDTDSEVTYCINKDAGIRYSNFGTTLEAVMANLADDNDKIVCGNEAAPAVTGVSFEAEIDGGNVFNKIEVSGSGSSQVTECSWSMTNPNTLTLKNPTIALANIYPQCSDGSSGNSSFEVRLAITVNVEEEFAVNPANAKTGLAAETNVRGAGDYYVLTPPMTVTVSDDMDVSKVTLDDITIQLDKNYNEFDDERGGSATDYDVICNVTNLLVVLHPTAATASSDAVSDIAFINADDVSITDEVSTMTINGSGNTALKGFGKLPSGEIWRAYTLVNDPRCNDKSGAWNITDLYFANNHGADANSLASDAWANIVDNCGVTNGDDKDWEPYLDADSPADGTFSTAYIANEPFTSLWQLGAIHRYEVGQTINLRKYNHELTIGKYEDGDAALLDFFKVTEAVNGIQGKFNPNCFNEGAYKFLLKDVPMTAAGDEDDTLIYRPNAGNPTLGSMSDVSLFVDFEDFTDQEKYTEQSWLPVEAFMNYCVPVDGCGSDREIEAFYGCTAGLLSTRYETFSIITVGQSLKWLEDIEDGLESPSTATPADVEALGTSNPVRINGKWYSVTGSRVQLVTVVRDCWLNKFKIVGRQRL